MAGGTPVLPSPVPDEGSISYDAEVFGGGETADVAKAGFNNDLGTKQNQCEILKEVFGFRDLK